MTCLGVSETACALVVGWFVVVVSGTVAMKSIDTVARAWTDAEGLSWGRAFWVQAGFWGLVVATWLFLKVNENAAGGGL